MVECNHFSMFIQEDFLNGMRMKMQQFLENEIILNYKNHIFVVKFVLQNLL